MRVIGTGWRYWATSVQALDDMYLFMDRLLDLALMTNDPVLQLVLGGGLEDDKYQQGADRALMEWAIANGGNRHVPEPIVYKAAWSEYGRAAGPLRNANMITGGADLVAGFLHPESRGTVDCLDKAKRARIPRMVVPWVPDKDPVDRPDPHLEVVHGDAPRVPVREEPYDPTIWKAA